MLPSSKALEPLLKHIIMKEHIRLKLHKSLSTLAVPHWQDFLSDEVTAPSKIHPDIDAVLAKYNIPVWVTKEYKFDGVDWKQEELESGLNRVYRLIVQKDIPIPEQTILEISILPIVETIEIGQVVESKLPDIYASEMSMTINCHARQAIGLDIAHQLFTRGDPQIIIAVLDTGVELDHPELTDALLAGDDFVHIIDGAGQFIGKHLGYDHCPDDEVGHGTHVTGIIAAKGETAPVGIVPQCRILPVRVLGTMKSGNKRVGAGLIDNINSGLKWAIDQGADVINMSLGIKHTGGGFPHQEIVDYAQRKDVTIVAASGNDGLEKPYYPGAFPYVITVGAVDERGEIANFSNYSKVDIVAPGTNVFSTWVEKKYGFSSGTSQAAPFVSGAVAMLKSYALQKWKHRLSDSQIKHILQHTADKIDPKFKHQKAGFGRLNLPDALRMLNYKLN